MGRSVMTAANAAQIIYAQPNGITDEDEFLAQMAWDDFIVGFKNAVMERFSSYYEADEWPHREVHTVLKNRLVQIAVSEYMGLVSINLIPKRDEWGDTVGLSLHHIDQIYRGIEECLAYVGAEIVNHQGTFSNGVGIYAKPPQPTKYKCYECSKVFRADLAKSPKGNPEKIEGHPVGRRYCPNKECGAQVLPCYAVGIME